MRKEFTLVCSSLFLLIFGTYVSGSVLVPFAKKLGGSPVDIGIIYSSMFVVRLFTGAPIGRLAQRRGVKTVLALSMTIYPLVAVAYWFSVSIPTLLVARLLHGVASAMALPMAMAYIGEVSPPGLEGRYMGVYTIIMHFAAAAGPIVGGMVYDARGERHAFAVLFILAVFSLFVVVGFTRHDLGAPAKEPRPKARVRVHSDRLPGIAQELLKSPQLAALCITNITVSVVLALNGATFTQLGLSRGYSMTSIGLLASLFSTVVGMSQIWLGRFCDRWNMPKTAVLSGCALSAILIFYPFVNSRLLLAALITAAGAAGAVFLAAVSALSAVLGKRRGMGNTMGFLGSAASAGNIVGYLGLGVVTSVLGISFAFWAAAIFFLVGAVLFFWLWGMEAKPG